MSKDEPTVPASDAVFVAVQRFLYSEAALLDRRAYKSWLALTTKDVRYTVTVQISRDSQTGILDYEMIDEVASGLETRVTQISTPKLTHAENPPSLTRRFVSGIEAWVGAADDEYVVTSSLLVYHQRPQELPGFYAGERKDVLRKVDGVFRLARRFVRLDQDLIRGPVSTLF
jgi:3-phenylpropionate/cinnamic acid dioxygenase small subunit